MSGAAKHWRIWLAFAIVFAAGVTLGVLAGKSAVMSGGGKSIAAPARSTDVGPRKTGPAVRGCGSGHMKERLLAHFSKKLDLTPEQKKKVEPILDAMTKRIEAIHKEKFPEIKKTISESMSEIESLLSPEQKKALETMRKRVGSCGVGGGGCRGTEGAQGAGRGEDERGQHKGKGKGRERRSEIW